jgi:sugar/nucleoside kinase (ribokinase family)
MDENTSPRFLFAGQLRREFILFPNGASLIDVPGGNVLYASVGLAIWEPDPPPGIISRVGPDYPQEWLENWSQKGLNVRGVRVVADPMDMRFFCAFTDQTNRSSEDPVAHFARLGLPFPRALLGYKSNPTPLDSRTRLLPTSLRQGDIPTDFLDASAAHLCPLDYLTHSVMPAILRQAGFTIITMDPSPGYMNPTYWGDMPTLLTGLTAFLPSEEEMRALFGGRYNDLWEMAVALASFGCEIIVIKRGERGQLLYDAATRTRWEVPSYPSRLVNPIGAGDAFCGGFLAGFRRSYDPLEAVLYGNISASLVVEGHELTYALEALPGLAEARLRNLRQSARKI